MNVRFCSPILAWVCMSTVYASDVIRPSDPAQRFERLIFEGVSIAEANEDDALFFLSDVVAAKSMVLHSAIWTSKSVLNVCFWNGTEQEKQAVAHSAERWNGKAGMTMSFYTAPNIFRVCTGTDSADIRVALDPSKLMDKYEDGQLRSGNWSLIGRQSMFVPPGKPSGAKYAITMNLPYIGKELSVGNQAEIDFTVGHEFGHALGLLHEFQSSVCEGWIDIDKFAKDQGWYGADAQVNLAPVSSLRGRLVQDYVVKGNFDVASIMQYNFPVKYYVIKPDKKNPCQRTKDVTAPSEGDIKTIVALYGNYRRPSSISGASPWSALQRMRVMQDRLRRVQNAADKMNPAMSTALGRVQDFLERLENFEQGMLQE